MSTHTHTPPLPCSSVPLAQAVGIPVSQRSGGRYSGGQLAPTLVATKIVFIYSFIFPFFRFSSVATFSLRRSAWIKKHIYQKLMGAPKTLWVVTFPDPINHFGAPSGDFGFFRRFGVAGSEHVPPAPLGWYLGIISSLSIY